MIATARLPRGSRRVRGVALVMVALLGPRAVAASTPAAPAVLARDFLAGRPDLLAGVALSDLTARPARMLGDGGALVELTQTYRGLAVVGRSTAVRLAADGRVEWTKPGILSIPADFSTEPSLDAARAIELASGEAASSSSTSAARARLTIHAIAGEARLVWEVALPRDLQRLEQLRILIDAHSGLTLRRENLLRFAAAHHANGYLHNPIATPAVDEFILSDLPDGATTLAGPDVSVVNCVDHRVCAEIADESRHFCALAQTAVTNDSGNFLDIVRPASDLDPEDPFAEVQMYFHVGQAYAFFRELAEDPSFSLESRPLLAVANFKGVGEICRDGVPPADSVLGEFDNAFFAPAGGVPAIDEDVIAFGQGSAIDFSYDGDVVYHELGHALAARLSDLAYVVIDEHGLDSTPGGMQEGFPDYFSSAFTGDPLLGEYVGPAFTPGLGAVRDLENDLVCPTHLTGESHEDSKPWAAALWAIRQGSAPEERPVVDRAVFTVLDALDADSTAAIAQVLLSAELGARLGPAAAARAEAEFAARGLIDCDDRVRPLVPGERHQLLLLGGYGQVPGELVPAPLQFRIEVPRPATSLRFGATSLGNDDATLLLKPDEPIRWTWSAEGGSHDAPESVTFTTQPSTIIARDIAPGIYYVQLVGTQTGEMYSNFGWGFTVAEPDAGVDADAGTDAAVDDGRDEAGCGCASNSPGGAASALLLAALVHWLLLRRRRTGQCVEPRGNLR